MQDQKEQRAQQLSDLEMTKLCAEAMGFKPNVTASNDIYVNFMGYYEPLTNDAQAMALARRFMMTLDLFTGSASIPNLTGSDASAHRFIAFSDESINRAIVECVAKMQREL